MRITFAQDRTSSPSLQTSHLSCQKGYYFDPHKSKCSACSPSTVSQVSPLQYTNWTEFPSGFSSFGGEDQPWILEGGSISTGKLPNKYATTTLRFVHFSLDTEEVITVELFVVAEESKRDKDGLYIYVDGKQIGDPITRTNGWETKQITIASGNHVIDFTFKKHKYISDWNDFARIRSIVVTGRDLISLKCHPCSAGHHPNEDRSRCVSCPANTYSSEGGNSECKPCESAQTKGKNRLYSLPGATKCVERPHCTEHDYEAVYTQCVAGKRTKTWRWKPESVCLEKFALEKDRMHGDVSEMDAIQLPPTESDLPCQVCPTGTFFEQKTNKCVGCPVGTYLKPQQSTDSQQLSGDMCQKCPAGSAPVTVITPTLDVADSLQPASSFLSTRCESSDPAFCNPQALTSETPGWISHNGYLSSGGPFSGPLRSILVLNVSEIAIAHHAFVRYNLTTFLKQNSLFTVYVDGYPMREYNSQINGQSTSDNITLLPGDKTVTFVFSNEGEAAHDTEIADVSKINHVEISNLHIVGAHPTNTTSSLVFGAASCEPCLQGTYSESGFAECRLCPAGSFAAEKGQMRCNLCPANSISQKEGSTACISCGLGTVSSKDRTKCVIERCGVTYTIPRLRVRENYSRENHTFQTHSFESNDPSLNESVREINLAVLMRKNTPFGPYIGEDSDQNQFYISVCNENTTLYKCVSPLQQGVGLKSDFKSEGEAGNAQSSVTETYPPGLPYACMVTADNRSISLGQKATIEYVNDTVRNATFLSHTQSQSLLQTHHSRVERHVNRNANPSEPLLETGIAITYVDGDVCEESESGESTNYSLQLRLICSPSQSSVHSSLSFLSHLTPSQLHSSHSLSSQLLSTSVQSELGIYPDKPFESPKCRYNFRWYTIHACPLCRPDDYTTIKGECLGGTRQVAHVLKPNVSCNDISDAGGYRPKVMQELENCTIPSSFFTKAEKMTALSLTAGVIGFVLLIFAVVMTLFIILFVKRKQSPAYHLLNQPDEADDRTHLIQPHSSLNSLPERPSKDEIDGGVGQAPGSEEMSEIPDSADSTSLMPD